ILIVRQSVRQSLKPKRDKDLERKNCQLQDRKQLHYSCVPHTGCVSEGADTHLLFKPVRIVSIKASKGRCLPTLKQRIQDTGQSYKANSCIAITYSASTGRQVGAKQLTELRGAKQLTELRG
ncbi:hypothetical protein BHM03_00060636, partial [Ensete ventricosum]